MAYTKYSLTPANNTAAPPDGAPEGMLPSAVNDTMRDMMAQIRDCGDGIRDGTYTMTAPKITGGTITGAAFTGNTFTSPVISGGTINNATIGATTATTGKFTTLEATGVATFSAGAVGTPAITTTGDTNTGIFFPAADTIAFAEGGAEAMRIDSSGNTTFAGSVLGTASTFEVGVNSSGKDTRFGVLSGGNGRVEFYSAGSERMRIDSSGNVGIGISSPGAKLDVYNSAAAAANNEILRLRYVSSTTAGHSGDLNFTNQNGTVLSRISSVIQDGNNVALAFSTYSSSIAERMRITSAGYLLCPGVFNNTTANAANVYVFSTGDLTRSTSSRKYKTDIVDYSKGLNEVMLLRPVSYKGINDGDKQFAGLIAEEVADKGLVEFVQYAEDGTPDGLAYPHMIALLTKAIQEQQALIENLTTRLNELEGN